MGGLWFSPTDWSVGGRVLSGVLVGGGVCLRKVRVELYGSSQGGVQSGKGPESGSRFDKNQPACLGLRRYLDVRAQQQGRSGSMWSNWVRKVELGLETRASK